jgi:hypothetical protein
MAERMTSEQIAVDLEDFAGFVEDHGIGRGDYTDEPLISAAAARIRSLVEERGDLAMLVRRLCRRLSLTTNPADAEAVQQANDYLNRKNLQGSPLR